MPKICVRIFTEQGPSVETIYLVVCSKYKTGAVDKLGLAKEIGSGYL